MSYYLVHLFNGFSFGMVLFLIAAGMSVTFGMMHIINMAHGSFFLLGAYICLVAIRLTGNFFLAVVIAGICVGIISIATHYLVLRHAKDFLAQLLVTVGLLLIFADVAILIWGGTPQIIRRPDLFSGSIELGATSLPSYRVLIGFLGPAVALLLGYLQEKTRFGALVRAGVDDAEMLRGLGVNVPLLMTAVFAFGALLAGAGGGLAGAFVGMYPGLDVEAILFAFVVVVLGGVGSLRGAFVGAIIVGMVDSFGRALFPDFAYFALFALMIIGLSVKPRGLWGRDF